VRRAVLVAAAVLVATAARADDYLLLHAAQAELQLVRSYLQAAGHNYEGHRKVALDEVNQALRELREELESMRREQEGHKHPSADSD